MNKIITILLASLFLVVGCTAAYERFQPVTNYVQYHAVVGFPTYRKSPSLEFISVSANQRTLRRIAWRDSIWCRSESGQFEEVDVYNSHVDNRKPTASPQSLIDLTRNSVKGENIVGWHHAIISEAAHIGKTTWKYQLTMDWPTENTPCYGNHKITITTPIFGFERSIELDSPVFWLLVEGDYGYGTE